MDKQALVAQLIEKLQASEAAAERERASSAAMARDGATARERRQDPRVALEFGNLAQGHRERAERARFELAALASFRPQAFGADAKVALGALVEIECPDTGEGRTIFLAPAGAGIELAGPDGDGLFSVITPRSPIGQALVGARKGDTVEVLVRGETRYWDVTWVG